MPQETPDLRPDDYVSPGLIVVTPDAGFPHLRLGDVASHPWPYLRRDIGHAWYVDERFPLMGFLNRDEAAILHNIALAFAGRRALEIGCWMGWSTCHLALGGVVLDVVDPALANPVNRQSVEHGLEHVGKRDAVTLHAASSPQGVQALIDAGAEPWSLFFIDGDHEAPGPDLDVEVCLTNAAPDAAFIFHDLTAPAVASALRVLEARGFSVLLYQTTQIMGVAWRGNVSPLHHIPDPAVVWQLPHHLVGLPVSGVEFFSGSSTVVRQRLIEQGETVREQTLELASRAEQIAWLNDRVEVLTHRLNTRPTFGQRVRNRLRMLVGLEP